MLFDRNLMSWFHQQERLILELGRDKQPYLSYTSVTHFITPGTDIFSTSAVFMWLLLKHRHWYSNTGFRLGQSQANVTLILCTVWYHMLAYWWILNSYDIVSTRLKQGSHTVYNNHAHNSHCSESVLIITSSIEGTSTHNI